MWNIETEPIRKWLDQQDHDTIVRIAAALQLLREHGPDLKRPLVGKIKGSHVKAMKELRPGSAGHSEIRILFVFDPKRNAVMLVAGDKQRKWNKWYDKAIPEAEARYTAWLTEQYGKDTK